ncbi:glycosyltransferase family A protein [Psychroflexus halocasei]|nr:glycosyltransferase family 2 protein [Psychroflexus halocasei]
MFSVVIPVHNKSPHLERSINSVLNQTYKGFELILVDDASTDGSSEKLEEFQDENIRLFTRNTPGPGGYAARNLGIKEARSEWVAFLDADDAWELNYLENVCLAIKKEPTAEIFSTNWDNVYSSKVVKNNFFEKFEDLYVNFSLIDFFRENYFIWTSAVTIKRSLLIKSELFPENRCKRGGDVDTWIRCLQYSKKNIWINRTLAHYHKNTVNQVTDNATNPVKQICALATIEKIREDSNDKKLLNSIDFFLSKVVYHKMISDYRRDFKPSLKKTNIIHNLRMRSHLLTKYFIRVIFLEKRRN